MQRTMASNYCLWFAKSIVLLYAHTQRGISCTNTRSDVIFEKVRVALHNREFRCVQQRTILYSYRIPVLTWRELEVFAVVDIWREINGPARAGLEKSEIDDKTKDWVIACVCVCACGGGKLCKEFAEMVNFGHSISWPTPKYTFV